MCGIFGFAKKGMFLSSLERFKLQGAVMDLTVLNESRGKDGTGFLLVSAREAVLFKEAKPSAELLQTKRMRKLIRKISNETLVFLGHTRLATVGEVSSKNCHPFVSKDFAGVHNGHFVNREKLLAEYGVKQETNVDSEAIFRVLDGAKGTFEVAGRLSEMLGDFALALVRNNAPHRLCLIRNVERSLHAVYIEKLRTLLWSSEKRHLEYALRRNFLKGVFLEIKNNVLYEFDVRRFSQRWSVQKTACEIKSPIAESLFSNSEGSYRAPDNPYLFTYNELRYMGYLDATKITEKSKLSCSLCEEVVEAGKLFYDEVSGGSFCEGCSFDYLSEYEPEKPNTTLEEAYAHEGCHAIGV